MNAIDKTYVLAFEKAADDNRRRQGGTFLPSLVGSTIGGAAGTGGALWIAYELAKKKFGPTLEGARGEIESLKKMSPLQKIMYFMRKRK